MREFYLLQIFGSYTLFLFFLRYKNDIIMYTCRDMNYVAASQAISYTYVISKINLT